MKIWSELASRQVGSGSKFQASALKTTSLEWTRFLPRSSGIFLGPQGPLVLPSVGPVRPSVRPVRAKNLDHLYTGIYAL